VTVRRNGSPYPYGLTKRQLVVAKLIAGGNVHKQIVAELGISRRAVDEDTRALRIKLDAATTAQAVILLAKRGLV
jgi:DNA-binding CsgD family transcriptional regulator